MHYNEPGLKMRFMSKIDMHTKICDMTHMHGKIY